MKIKEFTLNKGLSIILFISGLFLAGYFRNTLTPGDTLNILAASVMTGCVLMLAIITFQIDGFGEK